MTDIPWACLKPLACLVGRCEKGQVEFSGGTEYRLFVSHWWHRESSIVLLLVETGRAVCRKQGLGANFVYDKIVGFPEPQRRSLLP